MWACAELAFTVGVSDGELGAAAAGQPCGAREQSLSAGGGTEAAERRDEAAEGSGKNTHSFLLVYLLWNLRSPGTERYHTLKFPSLAQTVLVFTGRDCRSRAAVWEVSISEVYLIYACCSKKIFFLIGGVVSCFSAWRKTLVWLLWRRSSSSWEGRWSRRRPRARLVYMKNSCNANARYVRTVKIKLVQNEIVSNSRMGVHRKTKFYTKVQKSIPLLQK